MKKKKITLYRPDGGCVIEYSHVTQVQPPSPNYPFLTFRTDDGREVVTTLQFVAVEQ